jgi:hypothetical protein
MKYFIFILFIPLHCLIAQNDFINLNGKVIDASTLEPITSANILIVGTLNGTVTNIDGNFNLILPIENNTIKVSAVGYEPQSLTLICLNDDDINGSQIVVGLKYPPIDGCFILNYDIDSVSAKGRTDAINNLLSGKYYLIQKSQVTKLQENYSYKYSFSFIVDIINLREYRVSYNEIILMALKYKYGNEILQTLKAIDWENN